MKQVHGKIRWVDTLTGQGQIRLDDGTSYWFHVCNFIGANSYYPHLVTNVSIQQGDNVTATIDSDPDIVRACGLSNIQKVG